MQEALNPESPLHNLISRSRRPLVAAEADPAGAAGHREPPAPGRAGLAAPPAGTGDQLPEGLFPLIFDELAIGLAVLDDAGNWLTFNQAFCDVFGANRDEIAATNLLDLVPPEDRAALRDDLALPAGEVRSTDRRFVHRRQGLIWGRVHLSATPLAGRASPARICQITDVTPGYPGLGGGPWEQQHLIGLISDAPIAIALFDTSMRYLAHSERWLTMYDIGNEPIIGRSHYEVMPAIPERWREVHRRCLTGEVLSAAEDAFDASDGKVHHLRWTSQPWRTSDGAIAGIILVTDPIDELIRARRVAQEATRHRTEFLAHLSREIRTPMNDVLGMVGLLLETKLDAEQQDLAATILDSGQALVTLLDDVFHDSRIESGRLVVEQRDFNLLAVFDELIDVMFVSAQSRGIELLADFPVDLPEWYRGDPGRLRQILMTLVGNAIKQTTVGEVRIAARALPLDEPAGATIPLRISVHDTGAGIEPGRLRSIFEPPTPAEGNTSYAPEGSGLKLPTCRSLAERLGGTITLASEPGRGSTFSLDLRLTRPPGPTASQTIGRPLVGTTTLVADGNASARTLIRARLEAWGCEVIEAATADDALGLIRAAWGPSGPAVLLIAERLVELHPDFCVEVEARCAGLPVVLMTGFPRSPLTESSDLPTIAKPIRPGELLDVMTAAFLSTAIQPEPTPPLAESPPAPDDLTGVRVLLAEDNMTNQKVAVKMLHRLGCRFEVVADGLEALDKLAEADFDVVLMDMQMPRMDGYRATEEIRRRERALTVPRHLPIIAMTAHALQGDRERCLAAQMDDYLSKPVSIAELGGVLARWARRSQPGAIPPAPPILRLARLQELSQGDIEFERELLECLLTDIATGMDRLQAALEPIDPPRIATVLHGIVGACRTVGAEDLGLCCRDRETQAHEPGFRPDPAWLATIERKRDDLGAAVAAHLRNDH